MDNAIIVQEAKLPFQRSKCHFGKMMLKIDIEKAFERLE